MVAIVDPHLRRSSDYPAFKEASDLGILVKPKSGEGEYEGWCWPGGSSWTDFFDPKSWDWWRKMFKTNAIEGSFSWVKSTPDLHIWNDMNEVCSITKSIPAAHCVCSLPSSTVLKLPCPKITSTTADGSIVTSTTSTACSS